EGKLPGCVAWYGRLDMIRFWIRCARTRGLGRCCVNTIWLLFSKLVEKAKSDREKLGPRRSLILYRGRGRSPAQPSDGEQARLIDSLLAVFGLVTTTCCRSR